MLIKGLFLAFCALSAFSEITEDDNVWVLTDANFNEALDLQPNILVEFYAPWCGHCKSLAPEYAKAAKTLLNNNPPIRIAKVDATANTELAKTYGIKGYPALKYFIGKESIDYKGGRTEDTIVSWVLKKNQPSLSIVDCACDLDSDLEKNKVTTVLFAQKETPEFKIFEHISQIVDGSAFLLSTGADALEKYSITEPSIILFKDFDEERLDYTGEFNKENIINFVNDKKKALVLKFDEEAIELIFREQNPVIFLFSQSYEDYETMFRSLSDQFKGVLLFCEADLLTTDNGRLSEFLGILGTAQPTAVILDFKKGLAKFKLTGDVNQDSLKTFINGWKANTLEEYIKSEEIPQNSHENNVRVLVGKNFADVVFDKTKDVLVEFYAPWCGHCKQLAPHYERVATELKSYENIIIAKIDGTLNEIKGIDIKGYPTLKFFAANNKKPIDFEGNRDFEGLLSFIKQKATTKLEDTPEKIDL